MKFYAVLPLLLLAAILLPCGCSSPAPSPAADDGAKGAKPDTVHVYYFHRTLRCPSCERIEAWTKTAVETSFPVELESGKMVWQSVNVDEPEFAHFNEDYDLNTQSVVVSEWKNGREARWKNLEEVWDLLDDQPGFQQYVEAEVRDFLSGNTPAPPAGKTV